MLYVATNLLTFSPALAGIPAAALPPCGVISVTVAAARSDVIESAVAATGSVTRGTFREARPARRVPDTRLFYRLTPGVYRWILRQVAILERCALDPATTTGDLWAALATATERMQAIQAAVNEEWTDGQRFEAWREAVPELPRATTRER